jgi:hypothetical protein
MKTRGRPIPLLIAGLAACAFWGALGWVKQSSKSEAPSTSPAGWREGGLYSIVHEYGGFGVVKVLVIERDVVHVRLYKNRFSYRPKTINQTSLTLGTREDVAAGNGSFGIGHLPLSESLFCSWRPVLLAQSTVQPEELEGYEVWKDAKGGVWGSNPIAQVAASSR